MRSLAAFSLTLLMLHIAVKCVVNLIILSNVVCTVPHVATVAIYCFISNNFIHDAAYITYINQKVPFSFVKLNLLFYIGFLRMFHSCPEQHLGVLHKAKMIFLIRCISQYSTFLVVVKQLSSYCMSSSR